MSIVTTAPENARLQARSRRSGGLVHLVAAGLLWGTGGLTGRLLGQSAGLAALAVATYRLAIGGTLIVAFLLASGRLRPAGRRAWSRIVQIGLLAVLFQGCYFSAVALTDVSLATLVTIGVSPVLVLGFEQVTGRRRVNSGNVTVICLALVGLTLLVGWPSGAFTMAAVLGTAALATLSAAGFTTVSLISTHPVPGLDDLTVTGYGFILGGLLLAPVAQSTTTLAFHPTAASAALVLALGIGPTALAYTLYFRGLRTIAAGTATVVALLEPLTGALLAAVFLGDRLGIVGLAGASLLASAVVLAARTTAG
jgi:drug/metabolite transporter, DME family